MIAIVQFRTDSSIEHEQKCFRKYLPGIDVEFLSIFDDDVDFAAPHELLQKYDKLILSGSGEFLLSAPDKETADLTEKLEPLMDYVLSHDFPTMGVCFGNQLLAKYLGAPVTNDFDQAEAGIQQVKFTEEGRKDPIFAGVNNPINVSQGHEDSVTQLPESAVHLAYSDKCKYQGFRFGNNVYGMQFHAELDAKDLEERLDMYDQYDEHRMGFEAPGGIQGPKVLYNFATL